MQCSNLDANLRARHGVNQRTGNCGGAHLGAAVVQDWRAGLVSLDGGDVDYVAPLSPLQHVADRLLSQAEHGDDVHLEGALKTVPAETGNC